MGVERVRMNSAGARALLRSAGSIVRPHAERAAASANAGITPGTGYQVREHVGPNRARASVGTTDFASIRHNAKTNAILKGL